MHFDLHVTLSFRAQLRFNSSQSSIPVQQPLTEPFCFAWIPIIALDNSEEGY